MIPVLNEAQSIRATLDRLTAQDAIDEIVVVDNGSTDETPDILAAYALDNPKVTVVDEPERGVARARNTGFDKARGDFLARTDADTIVAPDWAEVIRTNFTDHPEYAALTGITTYFDSPVGFFLELGYWLQAKRGQLGGRVGNMHGPNMAIRATAWDQVRADTSVTPDVIDDLDLALCLTKRDLHIEQPTTMRAQTSARRRRTSPAKWWQFQLTGLNTISKHGYKVLPYHRVIITGAWLSHTIQWPIYRLWDFDRRRFTFRPGKERMYPLAHGAA
ncbi:glycosyltransferase family 2 protein [Nocardia sp. NPDC004722]